MYAFGRQSVYRVVDEEQGLLRPHLGPMETGGPYVGDHLFGDVHETIEATVPLIHGRAGQIP